jgi:hypothetical protein
LLACPFLTGLTTLGLRHNPLPNEAPQMLAESTSLPHLTSLDLGDCCFRDDDLAILLSAPFAPQLTELLLDENDPEYQGVTDAGLRTLAAAPRPHLRALSVARNHFTAEGVAILARSPNLPALSSLDLGAWIDWVGEAHPCEGIAEALADSPLAARLVSLDLMGQGLNPDAVAILARTPMPRLRRLSLSWCPLGDEGVRALLAAPWASRLRSLELADCRFGLDGIRALAQAPLLGRLTDLHLSYRRLGIEALGILLDSPYLTRRTLIHLGSVRDGCNMLTAFLRERKDRIPCRLDGW